MKIQYIVCVFCAFIDMHMQCYIYYKHILINQTTSHYYAYTLFKSTHACLKDNYVVHTHYNMCVM